MMGRWLMDGWVGEEDRCNRMCESGGHLVVAAVSQSVTLTTLPSLAALLSPLPPLPRFLAPLLRISPLPSPLAGHRS